MRLMMIRKRVRKHQRMSSEHTRTRKTCTSSSFAITIIYNKNVLINRKDQQVSLRRESEMNLKTVTHRRALNDREFSSAQPSRFLQTGQQCPRTVAQCPNVLALAGECQEARQQSKRLKVCLSVIFQYLTTTNFFRWSI